MTGARFITFEGGEGAGKSTQIRRLAAHLARDGRDVVLTREPGGSPGAETVRGLLVTGDADRWVPLSEVFLLAAARVDHLERTIRPALARGATVLCDRFMDSTTAYQGYGHGLDLEMIAGIHAMSVGPNRPDRTIILDLPVTEGLTRAKGRAGDELRFEGLDVAFHERLRAGFLSIAAAEPGRCRVVDARGSQDAVAARIVAAVEAPHPAMDARP